MSNNAEPFKMVKLSNPRPIKLPWIFRSLGPFKAVWFLTELEEDRTIPEARLTGMRVNFKPHPAFELGLSRAIMFAGQGREGLGLRDYLDIFLATKENRPGKLDNNQLAGFDASVIVPLEWLIPVKSVKVYTDWIGEDEAGGLPSNWGKLFGAQFYDIGRTGRTDLQIEYADNHIASFIFLSASLRSVISLITPIEPVIRPSESFRTLRETSTSITSPSLLTIFVSR